MSDPIKPSEKQDAPSQYLQPVGAIDMLIGYGKALQDMASVHGIHNVFDDSGCVSVWFL